VRIQPWKSGPSKGQRPLVASLRGPTTTQKKQPTIGDSGCEAYTKIAWGVGIEPRKVIRRRAEGFHLLEGNMLRTGYASADGPAGVKGHYTVQRDRTGTWEILSDRQAFAWRDAASEGERTESR